MISITNSPECPRTSSNSHNNLLLTSEDCSCITDILIEDVLHLILRFLDVPSLQSLRLVSSFWNSFTLPHLNDRIFLSLPKVTSTNLPSSFTSIGGPISSFLLQPNIYTSPHLLSSVTYLYLSFSPPTDTSIKHLQSLLESFSNLKELKLTLFEWGVSFPAESNLIKSSPTPEHFYAEFPTLKSLKSFEVCGTLGAYSAYLTASLIKSSPNLTILSLPQITLEDESVADRNNARHWLFYWLSTNPEVTRRLKSFTWSPFNLLLHNLTESQLTNRRNLLKKLHWLPSLKFSDKLKFLKLQVPFFYAEKGTHRHKLPPGIVHKSLHTLHLQDFAYDGSSLEEDSQLNQDQDVNQNLIYDFSFDLLPNLKSLKVDSHVCEGNFIEKILSVSQNLVSLIITSDNCCSQYLNKKKSQLNQDEILRIFNSGNLTPHNNLQVLEIPFFARRVKDVITLCIKFPSLESLSIHVEEENNETLADTEVPIDVSNILEYAKRFRGLSWIKLFIHCSHHQQIFRAKCEMTSCECDRKETCTKSVYCENTREILTSQRTRGNRIHEISIV